MKNKFTVLTILLIIVSLTVFYQCSNNDSIYLYNPADNQQFENLIEVHDSMAYFINDTIQFLWDNPAEDIVFSTPHGADIFFTGFGNENPCSSCPAPYTVSVLELYRRGEMVKHSVQSFRKENSVENALVSGGMFHLRITDASGQDLNGVFGGITAKIPNITKANGYYNNILPFVGTNMNTPSGNISSYKENPSAVAMFNPNDGENGEYTLDNMLLGWNQPGANYNDGWNSTQISVITYPIDPDYSNTEVFFLAKDHTVAVALTETEGGFIKTADNSLPKMIGGNLVGISLKNGQLYFGRQQITVMGDDIYELELQPGNIAELLTMLNTFD